MSVEVAVSDLTGVGGLVHFPQFDTPIEPDDGAEGERWQHAPSSSEKPAGWVLLVQPIKRLCQSRALRRWLSTVK